MRAVVVCCALLAVALVPQASGDMNGVLRSLEEAFDELYGKQLQQALDAVVPGARFDYQPVKTQNSQVDKCVSPSHYITDGFNDLTTSFVDNLGKMMAAAVSGSAEDIGSAVSNALSQSKFEIAMNSLLLNNKPLDPSSGGMGMGLGFQLQADGKTIWGWGAGIGGGGGQIPPLAGSPAVTPTTGYGGGGGGGLGSGQGTPQGPSIGAGGTCTCPYVVCTCQSSVDSPSSTSLKDQASAVQAALANATEVYLCGAGGGGAGFSRTPSSDDDSLCSWGGGFNLTLAVPVELPNRRPSTMAAAAGGCFDSQQGGNAVGNIAQACSAKCQASPGSGFNACFQPCFKAGLQAAGVPWASL